MFRFIAIALFSTAIAGCATTEDGYDGCHGIGCLVDDPSQFESSSNYDRRGNKIYDSDGNYAGCYGNGCKVDDPSLYEDNPNFDDNGDYVGCHGEGCLVDDPGE